MDNEFDEGVDRTKYWNQFVDKRNPNAKFAEKDDKSPKKLGYGPKGTALGKFGERPSGGYGKGGGRGQKSGSSPFSGAGNKEKREFSSVREVNRDIEFYTKLNNFKDKMKKFYDGDLEALGWASVIKMHTAQYANKDKMYKYSKVLDKNGQAMITDADIEAYNRQMQPDKDNYEVVQRYNYEREKLLSTFQNDQLDLLRKQYTEAPYLSDYLENEGTPDGLFELDPENSDEHEGIVEQMNKLALGQKYHLMKAEKAGEKSCVIRFKTAKTSFNVPRV